MIENRPYLVVATPCFGGLVGQEYTLSLLRLQRWADQKGISCAVILLGNDALITRGRASLVAKFLDHPLTTHLLFIDSDITFSVEQVERMLSFDREFVAGLYPAKAIDWAKLEGMSRKGHPLTSEEDGLHYVGQLCEGNELKSESGFLTGSYAGTGFQLIKRSVFEKMMIAYPDLHFHSLHAYPPQDGGAHLYAFFDCMIDPKTGAYLSEDFAFCRRWRALGGEIWLDTLSKLTHTGPYSFRGNSEKILSSQ